MHKRFWLGLLVAAFAAMLAVGFAQDTLSFSRAAIPAQGKVIAPLHPVAGKSGNDIVLEAPSQYAGHDYPYAAWPGQRPGDEVQLLIKAGTELPYPPIKDTGWWGLWGWTPWIGLLLLMGLGLMLDGLRRTLIR